MNEQEGRQNNWENELPILNTSFNLNGNISRVEKIMDWLKAYGVIYTLKVLELIQLILSLRHVQLTMKFATNTSLDVLFHRLIINICEFFGMNQHICQLLDAILLVVIAIYAINLILGLLNETKKLCLNVFGKNNDQSQSETNKNQP